MIKGFNNRIDNMEYILKKIGTNIMFSKFVTTLKQATPKSNNHTPVKQRI